MAAAGGRVRVFCCSLSRPAHTSAYPLVAVHSRGAEPAAHRAPRRLSRRFMLLEGGSASAPTPFLPRNATNSASFFFDVKKCLRRLATDTRPTTPAARPQAPSSHAAATTLSSEREESAAVHDSSAAAPNECTIMHQTITSKRRLLGRISALKTYLLAANWQDYLTFVLNSAFWEAELRRLEVESRPFVGNNTQVEGQLRELRRLFDLMAQASDVRDHINQILELSSRATGLAGTGLNASEKLENFEEHVQAVVAEYDRLLKEYPEYCSLVEDCLGRGLAMMRQKQRFTFSALHRFFY